MKPVRILLSKTASDALTAAGGDAFAVVSKAMRCDADEQARWVIHLAPVTLKTAQDACRVLAGELVAAKPRKAPRPKI